MLEPATVESSALVSKAANTKNFGKSKRQPESSKADDKDSLWYNYCKKPRHTIDKCWKLQGKPPRNAQPKGQGQAYVASTQQKTVESYPGEFGDSGDPKAEGQGTKMEFPFVLCYGKKP